MADKDPDLGREGWSFGVHGTYDVQNDCSMTHMRVGPPRPGGEVGVTLRDPLTGVQIVEALRALADAVERGRVAPLAQTHEMPVKVPDEPFARHG